MTTSRRHLPGNSSWCHASASHSARHARRRGLGTSQADAAISRRATAQ
jgi:hypothetical protein